MSHGITAFPLPGLEIEIGTLMTDACARLGIESSKYPYDNSLVAYGDAQTICGIQVNQYSLDCYGYDGALKSVEYGIDPVLINNNQLNFKNILEILEKQFGIAYQKMGDDLIAMTEHSGNVLAYAGWKSEIFAVYLAIYSGIRNAETPHPYAGQLSFSWMDVAAAGAGSLQKQMVYVESLRLEKLDLTRARIFKVSSLSGYRNYREDETDKVRMAQRAIRSPLVFETPRKIKALIDETKSAIAFTPLDSSMLVSNSCDSAVLAKGSKSDVWCDNVLPAKGSGAMYLSVSGVNIRTKHSSKQIRAVLNWLSREMDIDVSISESYDC